METSNSQSAATRQASVVILPVSPVEGSTQDACLTMTFEYLGPAFLLIFYTNLTRYLGERIYIELQNEKKKKHLRSGGPRPTELVAHSPTLWTFAG
jgi:hypothetical protein